MLMLGAAPAEPVREMVAKHWDALPVAESSEAVPSASAEKWGKWHFWNGQWWARTMCGNQDPVGSRKVAGE